MKIQFIVIGWHYDPKELYIGLKELKDSNPGLVDVHWVCRKKPPKFIKDNFDWKMYDNVGLEWKGYTDGFYNLDLDDDTIVFFTHDDNFIKDWSFVNIISNILIEGEKKVMGNGRNPGFYLDPNAIISPGNTEEPFPYGSKYKWKEIATHKEFFDDEILPCANFRASFVSMLAKTFKEMKGLEWIKDPYDGAMKFPNGKPDNRWANMCCNMNGYKISKLFGIDSIGFLSETYKTSRYMDEWERGDKIVVNQN